MRLDMWRGCREFSLQKIKPDLPEPQRPVVTLKNPKIHKQG